MGRAMETGCLYICPAGVPDLRHLWWRPSTDSRAPTGFHQHPHADTIPDGHARAHKHPRADGDADSYTIPNGHSYAHKHSLPDADALVHSHGCTYYDIRTRSHAYP